MEDKKMTNNFPVIKQNTTTVLSKTKNLMGVASKILAKKGELSLNDDSWIEKLWAWADQNNVSDYQLENWSGIRNGLPRDKATLMQIDSLNFQDEKFISFPPEIGNLVNLTFISFWRTKLIEVAKEIGNLINLSGLCLSRNQIENIPIEIGKLIYLNRLDLNENQLNSLPKEIGNLINLEELNLQYNKLIELPEEIGNLVNLTALRINDNKLTTLPNQIIKLTNLTLLYFEHNPNLILTQEQKKWIEALKEQECEMSFCESELGINTSNEYTDRNNNDFDWSDIEGKYHDE